MEFWIVKRNFREQPGPVLLVTWPLLGCFISLPLKNMFYVNDGRPFCDDFLPPKKRGAFFLFSCRNYMNDSLRTDVFVRYSPETIACACIYLSARKLSIVLPKKPAWYLLFGSVEKDLKDICIRILKLYTRARVSWFVKGVQNQAYRSDLF